MSVSYLSATAPWPTFADGRRASAPEDLEPLRARIRGLRDVDRLEDICADLHGRSLGEHYGDDDPADPDEMEAVQQAVDDGNEELAGQLAGAAGLRASLEFAVDTLIDDSSRCDMSFDGVRWWASTGGDSFGDSPSDMFDHLRLLQATGICDAPLDAEAFVDVPAIAAAVTILDGLAAAALAAIDRAGVTSEARAAAAAALKEARLDVTGAARTLRRTMTTVTEQQRRR